MLNADADTDRSAADEQGSLSEDRELRLTASQVNTIRDHLLQEDGNERIALGYCTRSEQDYLLDELILVPDEDHAVSTRSACRADAAVEREHVTACVNSDRHLLVIHSHPFADTALFSGTDDDMMTRFRDWLQPLFPDTHLLFGVLGRDSLRVRRLTDDGTFTPLPVTVLGEWTLDRPLQTRQSGAETGVDWQRNDRTIRAIGLDGQQRLANTHIAVVGCGGIGSYVATGLARLGVGALMLVDPDEVERSNLPRLNGARPGDVGHAKVQVMQEQCWIANPAISMVTVYDRVQEAADQLREVDLVVGCVDRLTPRHWLNEFCTRHLIPYIDTGTVISLDDTGDRVDAEQAFIQTIVPGITGCFDCLDRSNPDRLRLEHQDTAEQLSDLDAGYIEGTDLTPEAAVLPLNLSAVADALNTVVDLVTGRRPPTAFLRLEQVDHERVPIHTQRSAACITCGENGLLAAGETRDAAGPDSDVDELPDWYTAADLFATDEDASDDAAAAEDSAVTGTEAETAPETETDTDRD